MRIVITGGGTGGHVFPALEIIHELKRQNNQTEILYVGNNNSLEEKLAKRFHIPFYGLSIKKFVGQSFFKKLIGLIYLKIAVVKSLWLLLKKRPDAVIGVGGYVSTPILLASAFLGIKRYICEQNVEPGLANKMLGYIAHKIFISFKESQNHFKANKTLHTGNPVRSQFFSSSPKIDSNDLRILITGGSLGSNFLNDKAPKVLASLSRDMPNMVITHQTGETTSDVKKLYENLPLKALVTPFIEDMPAAFLNHDLLISRAGATVCAEIMAHGMPAILVPYPFANAHQKYNAQALMRLEAAIMIEEDGQFEKGLAQTIKNLYSDRAQLKYLGKKAKSMGASKAAFLIANYIYRDLGFYGP
jgi:UDP-N-acetylglucosamine--N-acetylmuramyl-(pentapeptide) pyrophosphoryl-undecaprenol N-acetylglucosamine transferase